MESKPKKYIFVNGVMMLNPALNAGNNPAVGVPPPPPVHAQSSQPPPPPYTPPLAVISCMSDVNELSEGNNSQGLCPSTAAAIEIMKSAQYYEEVGLQGQSGDSLFEDLSQYFLQYEVPVGLLSKLLRLRDYRLNFMVDDSGSMNSATDVTYGEATTHVRKNKSPKAVMTRWEEAENRLHIMMDVLSFIPVRYLQICFMNSPIVLEFNHVNKTPQLFQEHAHKTLVDTFAKIRLAGTPTLATLSRAFNQSKQFSDPTSHYLLTDGVPSDTSVEELSKFIQHRQNPERNPLALISCTNVDSECAWMKEIEEAAPFTSEIDDFNDEREEIVHDQGPAFPYTKGLWLLSNLVAAMSPDDLDALDESVPFSRYTLDELLGRQHSVEDYNYYFSHNPHHSAFADYYDRLLNEPRHAREIVPEGVVRAYAQRAAVSASAPPPRPPAATPANHAYVPPPQPQPKSNGGCVIN